MDTAGDGFFAIFDQPAAAIACGSALFDDLRTLGIELFGLQILRRTEQKFGNQLTGGDRFALHHALHDGRTVDRFRQRLAHARILEWILRQRRTRFVGDERRRIAIAVEMQIDQPISDHAIDRQALVRLELGSIRRRHVFDHLNVTRQERSNTRRIVRKNS